MKKQYLASYIDRHGKQRHYVRYAGRKMIAIKAEPGTTEFDREYIEARELIEKLPPLKRRPRKPSVTTARLPRWMKTKKKVKGVYFVKGGERLKIGYSTDIRYRVQELQVGSPVVIEFVGAIIGATEETERSLHAEFDEYRTHGEWFEYGPRLADFIALVRTKQRQGFV